MVSLQFQKKLVLRILGLILAVGSYDPPHKKSEILRTGQNNTWESIEDSDYPTVSGL